MAKPTWQKLAEQPSIMEAYRNSEGIQGLKPVNCIQCGNPYKLLSRCMKDAYLARCQKCGHNTIVLAEAIITE